MWEDAEGSGIEISEGSPAHAEAQHMTSSEGPRTTKREIKRRDATDVDVSSDITILDSAFGKTLVLVYILCVIARMI